MKSLLFLLLLPCVLAFELPFGVSALFSSKATQNKTTTPSSSSPRIAIIGAGAGGTSAAFWISKAKERFGLDVQVDVYEAADYIGGRMSDPILTSYNSFVFRFDYRISVQQQITPRAGAWRVHLCTAGQEFVESRRRVQSDASRP